MKYKRRSLGFLLAFSMLFTCLQPISIYADENDHTEEVEQVEEQTDEPVEEETEQEQPIQTFGAPAPTDEASTQENGVTVVNEWLAIGQFAGPYGSSSETYIEMSGYTWGLRKQELDGQIYFRPYNESYMLGHEAVVRIGDIEYHFHFYTNMYYNVYELIEDENGGYTVNEMSELNYSLKMTSNLLLYRNLQGYSYFNASNIRQNPSGNGWMIDAYYVKESGEYIMDSPTDTGNPEDYNPNNGHTNYVLRNMTSLEDGHLVGEDWPGFQFSSGHMYINDSDGQRIEKVWCIQPEVLTFDLSQYEKRELVENARAAIAIIYGFDESTATDLDCAIIEAYVWSTLGYDVPFEQMGKVKEYDEFTDSFVIEDLSDEEMQYVLDTVARLDKAADAYEASKHATFTSKTAGVTIENGQLIIKGKVPNQIVLEVDDADMLRYYAQYGQMNLADGMRAVVDLENKQLILTLDPNVVKAGTALEFSLVPADFSTESTEYHSNYGKQI